MEQSRSHAREGNQNVLVGDRIPLTIPAEGISARAPVSG